MRWRGDWSGDADYVKDDVVKDNGVVYIATQENSGVQPTPFSASWEVFVPKAAQGGEGITFDTFADFASGAISLDPDTIVKTRGYFAPHDEGGATYKIVDVQAHDWELPLSEGKWASILNRDFVSYRMFGAPLNGTDDDGPAMRKAHAYADSIFIIDGKGQLPIYLCRIENHCGTIYKKDTDAITFNSDINLSGSILKVDDVNAAWFGIYVWGNNDSLRWTYEPSDAMKNSFTKDNHVIVNKNAHGEALPGNAVIMLEEDPYTARDDAGYSYTVARKELIVHDLDGMCSSPFTDDWVSAGGQEISVLVSDLINGGYKTETMYTTFQTSYNFAHPKHGLFVGCEVQMNVSANKYHCAVWVKRHNCEIRDFTFIPLAENLHNTVYKNTMIYLWNAYGVRVKNIQGFNAAGKKVGASRATSGYILRLTNCSDVYVSDCRLQGYWGATAMDSVKNVRFSRCHINRLDIHDYFANLWADECIFYNSAIQIGYGRGIASFTNSRFHINPAPGDSYPGNYLVSLNMSYGRIFEGTVYIDNCQFYGKNLPGGEFQFFKAEFSPTATTITPHFKFPECVVTNCQIYADPSTTHYSYFKITGTRRGTTSGVRPSHVAGVSGDNTVRWRYSGRSLDWDMTDNSTVTVGQIVRVTDRFLDNETPPKTQFYNKRYYRCTVAGNVNLAGPKPTNTSGTPFTNGTATLVYVGPDVLWKAKYAYNVGDICTVSHSEWQPMFIFVCERAGVSNGFFPTHSSGTVIDGINDPINEPNAVWWTYIAEKAAWLINWTADMNVTLGQRILVENRIYEVTQTGQLTDLPPYETGWMQTYDWGTAKLKFIGLQWGARQWYPLGAYCEARGKIYQVANHDGTTSGVLPVRGNENCVDGDIVWKHVSGSNTLPGQTSGDTWTSGMAPTHGQTVIANGNTYECIFDGKMVLPNKTVFKNVVTNMSNGQVFWFYTGTNIPTKAGDKPWTIIAEDCEGISQLVKFPSGMTKYFGNTNNPVPTGILATTGSGGGGGAVAIGDVTGLTAALDAKAAKFATALDGTKDLNTDAAAGGFYTTVWNTANNPPPGNSASTVLTIPGANANTAFAQIAFVMSQNKFYFRTSYWVSSTLTFNAWVEVGSGGLVDAASDGKIYGRKDGTWTEVPAGGGLTDAASDGKLYARKDGTWSEVPAPGEAANGLPTGGTTGQILKKSSSTNYAVEWANEPSEPVPTGGATGQLLAKASNTDLDLEWVDAPSGGGGSNDSTVGNVRLIKDVGRLYTPGNSGILRISLGASPAGDTFIAGTVYGYRHDTRQRWQVDFAGFTGASWGSLKVVLSPNCPFTDVRRAMWNGFPCILLGLTTTTWGYQMCVIPEVIVAYLGMASIAATWPMAIVNTETGITSIVAADEKKTLTVTS